MSVVIYSKDGCSFCVKAKHLLQAKSMKFEEFKLGTDITREQMFKELGREVRTIPQITIDGEYIGGYSELRKYFDM